MTYSLLVIFISGYSYSGGALIGLAIGDALGAPLEGLPSPRKKLTEMEPGGFFARSAGQITDDTIQAFALAESLAVCRRFSPYDLISRLVAGYLEYPWAFGPTSSRVLLMARAGWEPFAAAREVDRIQGSRSNGSVMRGPPLGVFSNGPDLEPLSLECSRLTHPDPVAGACSAWLNRMVSELCRGRSREFAFNRALRLCGDGEVAAYLGRYRVHEPVPSLDALYATHAAVHTFMTTRSFEEALIIAVNLGGDADTVGACCGALAGATYGLPAIPFRWLSRLEGLPELLEISWRLWAVSEP
jgi:ADP-ribosyl-[dinitrogen reductase] hydrolase